MLTGRLPFEGDSAVSVAIQHLSSIPLAPREMNPDIPEQLELICMKAMAPDLEKRYPSADAMIADLEAFRKNPGVNLDFELSDLRPEETDEPTQKLRSAVPPQLHRQGREPSYERGRRWEEDRYEDEQPSRLSGGKQDRVDRRRCRSGRGGPVSSCSGPSSPPLSRRRRTPTPYPSWWA